MCLNTYIYIYVYYRTVEYNPEITARLLMRPERMSDNQLYLLFFRFLFFFSHYFLLISSDPLEFPLWSVARSKINTARSMTYIQIVAIACTCVQ